MSDNETQRASESEDEDVFQRRLRGAGFAPPSEAEAEELSVYQAHGLAQEGRAEEGLTFYHHDGVTITVKFYAHLTDIICTSHQYLSLVYMDCIYTLQGRNLHELIPLLKRHKLDGLHCYRKDDFIEPAKGAVIYRIIRESHAEARTSGSAEG